MGSFRQGYHHPIHQTRNGACLRWADERSDPSPYFLPSRLPRQVQRRNISSSTSYRRFELRPVFDVKLSGLLEQLLLGWIGNLSIKLIPLTSYYSQVQI